MRQLAQILTTILVLGVTATVAEAQASKPPAGQASEPPSATGTTVAGDTGLWTVPTATVLPARHWTISFSRINQQDGQGFTNVSNFPLAIGFGVSHRAEVFGSWVVLSRLDRDTVPSFFESAPATATGTGGGLTTDYPYDRKTFVSTVGDLRLGAKVNLVNANPASLALRGTFKLGVGSKTNGASTSQTDFQFDVIVSRSREHADISGFAGMLVRSDPVGYNLTNGLRWGLGAGIPLGKSHMLTFGTELYGEHYFTSTITAPADMVAPDGSVVPVFSTLRDPIYLGLSLTWRATNGFFFGIAGEWNMTVPGRDQAIPVGSIGGFPDTAGNSKGYEIRFGYRPGGHAATPSPVSRTARPAPTPAPTPAPAPAPPPAAAPAPAPAAAPPPAPRANRPPTVRASCDPCTVEVGKTTTVSGDAQDPDGDPLTYQWSAAGGSFSNSRSRQTTWTAPLTPGPARLTVTVDDGHGGVVSSGVTVEVVAAGVTNLAFEEVHFDFDKSALRPDAVKILDDMIVKLKANPSVKIEIEGHTCNIGTAEYNLALSQRRAQSVLDYLVAHGISADRLHTTGYGLERPKYDNTKFDQRKLNRRAEFVVRVQ